MKNKINKYIDGEKLHNDFTARYENLKNMIDRDFAGNPEAFENKWMETKYWKEAFERGEYNLKWEDVMRQTFDYDQIHYNEAILHMEELWQRKLSDHEINLLKEVYKFSRLVEMENWFSKDIIEWQQNLRK